MVSLVGLDRRLGLPRRVRLSYTTWAAAVVLGQLRVLVNDAHRADVRDRGGAKNTLNDLQGALGELVGLEVLHRAGVGRPAEGLLDLGGSVDRPDLLADVDGQRVNLDAKCHLDLRRKRMFLVNEKARVRSVGRGVVAFLPVVTAVGRRSACVGRLVGVAELGSWRLERFRDPARQVPLTTFAAAYLGFPDIDWGRESFWGDVVVSPDRMHALADAVDLSVLGRVRRDRFSLDGLNPAQAREALLSLLPAGLRSEMCV